MINPKQISELLRQAQEEELKYCPPLPGLEETSKQPAAVLIPLFQDQGSWKMLFIKRTHYQGDRHSGQVAFPGGREEPQDISLLRTALRETAEELGIRSKDVKILGQSCPIITVTNYEITPFVGLIPWPYPLQLSPIEVEKTIEYPLDWLTDPNNHRVESWNSSTNPDVSLPVIFFNEYHGEVLWGATAQIVVDLLELIQII